MAKTSVERSTPHHHPSHQHDLLTFPQAINHVINNLANYPDDVVRQFETHVWWVMQFVRGSRSNDAPYETQYVLRKVLNDWIPDDALISSAALEEFKFFLNTADLWDHIGRTLNLFDTQSYKPLVVRIGSPEVYKHRPIFCIPLFHELGHFVDHHFKISELSMLLMPPTSPQPGISPGDWNFINLRHRMEHFADLFSSCYCGSASTKSLLAIAPDHADSPTHPSTAKRVATVDDFLTGRTNSIVNLIQATLKARGQRELAQWFNVPDLTASFNDVVTYRISNVEELYGIFLAGWDYLQNQLLNRTAPWADECVDAYTIEKTVNDLIEKSIRNFEICERWADVTADKK